MTLGGAADTETYNYNNYSQLSTEKLDGTIVATPSYDAYGRLQGVTYNAATSGGHTLSLSISRDSLGRENGLTYTLPNGSSTSTYSDVGTLSQSGDITSDAIDGYAQNYTYDNADRLTSASTVTPSNGTYNFTYSYATPTACTGTYNANSGLDSNITSSSLVDTTEGINNTQTYCYNNADQLTSTKEGSVSTTYSYDSHGNLSGTTPSSGFSNDIEYDSSDRAVWINDPAGGGTEQPTFDPANRVDLTTGTSGYYVYGDNTDQPIAQLSNTWHVTNQFVSLPGGVLMSYLSAGNPSSSSNRYSLPDLKGNVLAIAAGTGALNAGVFRYSPYGNSVGATSVPSGDNVYGEDSYGWLGTKQQLNYYWSQDFEQMGARLYIPSIGRFVQPDPIENGNADAYVYPTDPINNNDLSGDMAQRGIQSNQGPQLSRAEQEALTKYDLGEKLTPAEKKLVKSAQQKLKTQAKLNKERPSRNTKDIPRTSEKESEPSIEPDGEEPEDLTLPYDITELF